MDVIQEILNKVKHKFGIEKFNYQTCIDFKLAKETKSVFLFGIGAGADFYFENYTGEVVGIIDNDDKKHGLPIDLFIDRVALDKCKEKKVLDVSILKQYQDDEMVILIANLKSCEQIASQLESLGITNYFSLLAMEALRRTSADPVEDDSLQPITMECTDEIKQNKLVFYTMGGYSGHGKYIAEQLLKLRNDLDIVWIVNDLTLDVPEGIRLVHSKNRKKVFHEMGTSKIWIHDMAPLGIRKRPEQIYIQVKHWSSVTLKTFGFDLAAFRNEADAMEVCEYDSKMIDYIITGSKFDTDTCRRGFNFQGEVVEVGSPRSDVLFDEIKYRPKIRNYFHLGSDQKIALYAPTFRAKPGVSYKPEAYDTNIDYEALVRSLTARFSEDWKVLLRLHPAVSEASKTMKRPDYVIDAGDYPDSQELVAAADVMITDYSSIMFEPAFVRKPVFLYAPDRKEYINGERKLLIEYDTLPFPIAETSEELALNIENFDREQYVKRVDKFMEQYGVREDGHASERAARFISDLVDGIRSS